MHTSPLRSCCSGLRSVRLAFLLTFRCCCRSSCCLLLPLSTSATPPTPHSQLVSLAFPLDQPASCSRRDHGAAPVLGRGLGAEPEEPEAHQGCGCSVAVARARPRVRVLPCITRHSTHTRTRAATCGTAEWPAALGLTQECLRPWAETETSGPACLGLSASMAHTLHTHAAPLAPRHQAHAPLNHPCFTSRAACAGADMPTPTLLPSLQLLTHARSAAPLAPP